MKGFVIATESQKGCGELLFMVDRRKQKLSFWSNVLDDVFVYQDLKAAQLKAKSYKYNRPQVLSLAEASQYMEEVEKEKDHQEAMDSCEMGWDGHKNSF
jgi:hypothetical protein